MDKKSAKKRIEQLKKVINYHRYLYHVLDRQEISDSALDSLKKELFDLEQQYPEFVTPDSPTQRVGGKPLDKFEKFRHIQPMLSLNDAFTKEDIESWQQRMERMLPAGEIKDIDYFCELKFDGLSIELVYEGWLLKVGSTRGDGLVGENVTQNLKTIEAVPLRLREKQDVLKDLRKNRLFKTAALLEENKIKQIVVRGEAIIFKKEFLRINKMQEKAGLPKYANPRNIAAGSIRQLDPKVTASRHLEAYFYDLISDLGQETHEQEHQILKILGFKVHPLARRCKDLNEVYDFYKLCLEKRESLAFEIDGVVIQVNKNKIFERLGAAGKSPRGAIAYKFPLKQAETIVEDIKVQVGRTGAVTPIAVLKPVKVGGVTITRATLHNEDEIKRLDVRIGDTVIIGRAGDVIPEIVKVLKTMRTGKEKIFKMPKRCPACGAVLIKKPGEAILRCPNPNCYARQRRFLYHFVSKAAFDIEGLGPKIVDKLLEEKIITDAVDIFKIKEGDLKPLEGFAEKSAKNLIKSINSRKEIGLARFLYALGIRGVGEETAQDLAEHFLTLEAVESAPKEDLLAMKDIGPETAASIYSYFHNDKNLEFLKRLKNAGVKIVSLKNKKGNINKKIFGKTFVLTGTLSSMDREEAKERIRNFGGKVSESVSKNTDFLVLGDNPGSKLAKAKKLGVKIIKEKEFSKLFS